MTLGLKREQWTKDILNFQLYYFQSSFPALNPVSEISTVVVATWWMQIESIAHFTPTNFWRPFTKGLLAPKTKINKKQLSKCMHVTMGLSMHAANSSSLYFFRNADFVHPVKKNKRSSISSLINHCQLVLPTKRYFSHLIKHIFLPIGRQINRFLFTTFRSSGCLSPIGAAVDAGLHLPSSRVSINS